MDAVVKRHTLGTTTNILRHVALQRGKGPARFGGGIGHTEREQLQSRVSQTGEAVMGLKVRTEITGSVIRHDHSRE